VDGGEQFVVLEFPRVAAGSHLAINKDPGRGRRQALNWSYDSQNATVT
jgi:hypothetical protein